VYKIQTLGLSVQVINTSNVLFINGHKIVRFRTSQPLQRVLKFMIKKLTAIGVFMFLTVSSLPVHAEEIILRTECRKENTGGCTSAGLKVWAAPAGMYIDVAGIGTGTIVNSWGKNATCRAPEPDATASTVLPGLPVPVPLPIGFKAYLHIESGSGISNLGKVAFVNCKYNVTLYPIPK